MQEEPLDFRRYLNIALRWWWVLLLGPVIAGLISYQRVANPTPVYEARTTILIQQTQSAAAPTLSELQTSQSLATTYQRLITMWPVMEQAAETLTEELGIGYGPGQLRGSVRATVVPGTQLLEITAQHTTPDVATVIAQTVAEVFIDRTQQSRLAEIAILQAVAEAQGLTDPSQLLGAQLSAMGSLTIVDPAVVLAISTSGTD